MTQAAASKPKLRNSPLPGELSECAQLAQMIRVNQAGEYGAKRIYEGQLATIRDPKVKRQIQHMLEQELEHLDYFNQALCERKVRPTLMHPLWHVGGFMLGAATAAMGTSVAMACTVAVESVIDEHYREQEDALGEGEGELKATIGRFRAEEMEHHATGLAEGAEQAPVYPLLTGIIRTVTRTAIEISKRV